MVSFEFLAIILTGLGLTASIVYYSTILRNANKTRELQLKAQEHAGETRQAQLFMEIYRTWSSMETIKIRRELETWAWTDYDDFIQKYGVTNNPDAYSSFQKLGAWYEGIGVLIKRKLIDPTFVDDLMSGVILWGWETFGSIVREHRVRENMPFYFEFWEYLYEEISAIAHKQHPELAT